MTFKISQSPIVTNDNFKNNQSWISQLFQPRNSLKVFSFILIIIYTLIPLSMYLLFDSEVVFLKLAILTAISVVFLWFGSSITLFDSRFSLNAIRFKLNSNIFHILVWVGFLAFVIITFSTAPSIPILSSLQGASANELSFERGDFLKNRVGAELLLLYMSTIFTNTLVPYSIVLLYLKKSKFRHFFAFLFFLFCISFLAKALFLNLALPLLAYFAITKKLNKKAIVIGTLGPVLILLSSTILSLGGGHDSTVSASADNADYMSAQYIPSTPISFVIWRAVAVPIYTATDTLIVHEHQFHDEPLLGATSSLLSAIFGLERINLERYVFEHQFGSWNEIANANAVFIVDAYANFGYLGVIFFGIFIGLIFRWFRLSADVGFQSLWPLFAFVLFNASFIGMLLSNGFLYMLFHSLFLSVVNPKKSHD